MSSPDIGHMKFFSFAGTEATKSARWDRDSSFPIDEHTITIGNTGTYIRDKSNLLTIKRLETVIHCFFNFQF
jgi:hypothetical protein